MKKIAFILATLLLTFQSQAQFTFFDESLHPQKGDIVVGDINSDGFLDVIFSGVDIRNSGAEYVEQGQIMINNGNGTFTAQTNPRVITPAHLACIKFGDINGDGHLDVIFTGTGADNVPGGGYMGIALNNGNGVYTIEQFPSNDAKISCGFADFNNDGLLDYWFFGNGTGNCAIYFQGEDMLFTKSLTSFGSYNFVDPDVTVVDFDNDGYLDIFLTAWDESAVGTTRSKRFTALFRNDGFGNFTQYAQPNLIPKSTGSAVWGDIDGDGWLDLVLCGDGWADSGEDNDGIVRIYKNQNGTLVPQTTITWFRQLNVGSGLVLADWDNDGDLDLIVSGWNDVKGRQETALYLCTNSSSFTFEESPLSNTYFPGISESSLCVADLNNDGKLDLLMMGYNGNQPSNPGAYGRNLCGWCPGTATIATVKPAACTNLQAVIDNSDGLMVTFSWDAPASEAGKKGTTYNLALRNKTTGKWFYNPMAFIGDDKDGQRKVSGMGNVFANKRWELYDLPAGEYEWTVQAINGAYFGGAFAPMKTFKFGATGVKTATVYAPEVKAAKNALSIKGDSDSQTLNVYGVNGVKVVSAQFNGSKTINLPAGMYIVELVKNNANYKTKVVIQ